MSKLNIFRIILQFLILFALIWSPWWLFVLFLVICVVAFEKPYEIVAWSIIYDSLYAVQGSGFYHSYTVSIISIGVLCLSLYIRPRLLLSTGR